MSQVDIAETQRVTPRRVATASFIGTAIEWYDFFIYSMAAALVFGPLFFPELSSFAGTLAAFGTVTAGFVARPLAGVVMGHFGDRVGRKAMLVTSLMIMGIATLGVGLLPTYESIGIWAPILLVTLRVAQSVGVAGEWSGAVLMAIEHAPANRRAFYGSFPQMGVPAGLAVANLAFLAITKNVSPEAFATWGWRVPFLASAVLVAVGLFIRLKITESPDFEKLKSANGKQRFPIVPVLRNHMKAVLLVGGAMLGLTTMGYIFMVYLLSYGPMQLGVDRDVILAATLVGAVLWLIAIPTASAQADRGDKSRVLLLGAAATVAAAAVLMPLVDTGRGSLILLALVLSSVSIGLVYGPVASSFAELFPANVRYSGTSLGYQGGSIFGGGLAPIIAASLFQRFGTSLAVTVYVTATCLVSLACVAIMVKATSYSSGDDPSLEPTS